MPAPPRKRLVVLTCMDARIDVYRLLDLAEGDAHVLRNAGGLVTEDVIRSITLSQTMLETKEVKLVMHTDCGLQGHPDGFADLEEAVRDGVERLKRSSADGTDVSGWIYDVEGRRLREVV
jgi:carbonic anhydrase